MPFVPYPNPQKVGKIQKKFGFFPYKSKNDGLQEKTYRPSHLVRMTGLVARETSVIAIVAQHAPIVSAAQGQVANIVCRQLKNCRKSVAVTKKKRKEVVFCCVSRGKCRV